MVGNVLSTTKILLPLILPDKHLFEEQLLWVHHVV